MARPDVKIVLGNGRLGRTAATDDGVAGLILTGKAVDDKLVLGTHYVLSSPRDLVTLGITAENNPLAYKDITAFYAQAGDGAELHLMVVAEATTLAQMAAVDDGSPMRKLLAAAGGRIRLLGLNRLPPAEYSPTVTSGIDQDAIDALAAAQSVAESYTDRIQPVRGLIPALGYDDTAEDLFSPREASYNRFALVLASDDPTGKTAAIGRILGRAAAVEPQISIARVRDGAIDTAGYMTNGKTVAEMDAKLDALHDAGYIIYRTYPTLEGVYLNDDPTAAPLSDDYANLNLGRVVDKAIVTAYNTYLTEIMDNVVVDASTGKIAAEKAVYYQSLIERAIAQQMSDAISGFSAYVDPDQNVLGTSCLEVSLEIVPQGTLRKIVVNISFSNPYNN